MPTNKWQLAAAHAIRKYVWHLLQTELGWTSDSYGGLTPITTPSQEPEFNSFNEPYLVYTYSINPPTDVYGIESEIMAISVFSQSGTDIDEVVNLLNSKLRKLDESAQEVNDFLSANFASDSFYRNFEFKSITVTGATGPGPAVTEGGRRDGYVTVGMTYTLYEMDPGSNDFGRSIRI